MDNINLTKEDYENLKKLFFITQKIKKAYDNLAVLEINNQKDSEEYTKWTNYLQALLELEEQIYTIIGNNPKKLSDMLDYILGDDPYCIADVLVYLNNDEEEEILKNRVAARFDYIVNTVPFSKEEEYFMEEEIEEDEEEKVEEFATLLGDETVEEIEDDFFYQVNVDLMMEQDIINTILEMLKNYLDNPYYENIKDILIKFKYKLAFAFKFIEKEFLENNFVINDTLFWQTKMYTDAKGKSGNEILKESKNFYAKDLLYEQYGYLLEMFYSDLNNKDEYAKMIIIEILVIIGLILADTEVVNNFTSMMESEISYLEENNVHNEKAKDFIFKSFSHIDEDKCLPSILSFRI